MRLKNVRWNLIKIVSVLFFTFILSVYILLRSNSKEENIQDSNNNFEMQNYENLFRKEIDDLMKVDINHEKFTNKLQTIINEAPNECTKNVSSNVECNENFKLKSDYLDMDNTGEIRHPTACNVINESIAIIIPFRDRFIELYQSLPEIKRVLEYNLKCYNIFVIEQFGKDVFNKGRLNNAGFLEVIKLHKFSCIIYHDTDLVPFDINVQYNCYNDKPIHIASAVEMFNYRLPYQSLVGGVIGFTPEQYIKLNGFSNLYWGWGLEDDDIEIRMKLKTGYQRVDGKYGKFRTIKHKKQSIYFIQSYRRKNLIETSKMRMMKDGLNNIKYSVVAKFIKKLYTHIVVDIGKAPKEFLLIQH